ncbi:MAG: formate dehydrogenase accessory protein FdhE [Dehalococcoidales bacterium]|nr:formate dehydrogenase accessory protein FdhE [Dehalococcoidales bacterium]
MATRTDSQVIQRLDELAAGEGLSRPLELYRRLLQIQSDTETAKPNISLDKETASRRLADGHPLLEFSDLAIDWTALRDTIDRIISLLAEYPEFPAEVFSNTSDVQGSVRGWFEKKPLPEANGNRPIIDFVLQSAMKPVLTGYAEAVFGLVDQEQWRRGYCPVCGGRADFGFLHTETGARWLLCSRCDAQWLFQRLECPDCGNQEPGKLAYFTDEQGLYRLYTCENCRRYLKAIDLRRAGVEVLLPLERLLTLHLDIQARESGYIE